jgi:hypothetical protein
MLIETVASSTHSLLAVALSSNLDDTKTSDCNEVSRNLNVFLYWAGFRETELAFVRSKHIKFCDVLCQGATPNSPRNWVRVRKVSYHSSP